MWQEPENKTLHYPDYTILECAEVYMQFCPCGPGLVCREAECRYARKLMGRKEFGFEERPGLEAEQQFVKDQKFSRSGGWTRPESEGPIVRERMASRWERLRDYSEPEGSMSDLVMPMSRRAQWP